MRSRLVVTWQTAVVLLVAALLAAAVGWYVWSGNASVKETDSGYLVPVSKRGDSMSAGMSGRITKVGRCLGLGESLTFWPHGTTVRGDRLVVEGRSYGLGDLYDGGGGTFDLDGDHIDPARIDAPPGCPITETVVYVSGG